MKKLLKQVSIVLGTVALLGLMVHCSMPSQTTSEDAKVAVSNRAESLAAPGSTVIKPNHISQSAMEGDIQNFYQYWKAKYLKVSNGNTPGGGYYIEADSTGGHNYPIKSNSESHGYGMIIFAVLGDQAVFDGMYNMYDKHRSTINKHLMSWVITQDEYAWQDSDSAADGDLDIAYALLLAHDKWGSSGNIDYLAQAKRIITLGIKVGDMNQTSKRIMRGDWDTEPYSTRSSDWMAGHLRAYYQVTQDKFWLEAADTIYSMINTISNNYSPVTGLMPDFVIDANPKPAPPNHLESQFDGDYYYNACRFPWRIATDYIHYGTPAAKAHVSKMLDWLLTQNNGDPAKTNPGWYLNGAPITAHGFYLSACFAGPFMVAAAVDPKYQSFLNKSWDVLKNKQEGYFEDTINLLCLLMASGKWQAPGTIVIPDTEPPTIPQNLTATVNGSNVILNWNLSSDNVGVAGYNIIVNGVQAGVSTTTTYNYMVSAPGTYTFEVNAFDAVPNTSNNSNQVIVKIGEDKEAPTVPTNVKAVASGSTIAVSWTASMDNVGVTGYKVYQNGVYLTSVTGTSHTVTGLSSGVYQYTVSAFDAAGNNSAQSLPATAEIIIVLPEIAVSFQKTGGWGTTIQGDIIIENKSSATVNGWELICDLDFTINSFWCGKITSVGNTYTITDAGWNGTLAPGGKATVGFIGSGTLSATSVTNATINGKAVTVTILP